VTHTEIYLGEARQIIESIDGAQIERLASELATVRENGGRVFCIGLGGSAANASHATNDLRKLCGIEAYCPTDGISEFTARANDEGLSSAFFGWLRVSKPRETDALFVFSVGGGTSSASYAIALGNTEAKRAGVRILGIVGPAGGDTAKHGDCVVQIPEIAGRITPHTEAFQMVVLHLLVSHPLLQRNPTRW